MSRSRPSVSLATLAMLVLGGWHEVAHAQRGAADLAAAATPAARDWEDVERAALARHGDRARRNELAALDKRLGGLEARRSRAPMARDAANRDQELAEVLRDRALLRWHDAAICRSQVTAANARRKRGAPANPDDCGAETLALDDAVAAYQRALAAYPNHLRAPELRVQLAILQLRAARERNEIEAALAARTALDRLERDLPPGSLRWPVIHWLAEDDADAGRTDLAAPRWHVLATAEPRHAFTDYARYRLAHARWVAGAHDEALQLAATLPGRGASGHAAILAEAGGQLRRWMQARRDAAPRPAATAANRKATTEATEPAAAAPERKDEVPKPKARARPAPSAPAEAPSAEEKGPQAPPGAWPRQQY
ncbi:MAG: hypothetical protein RIT45_1253 [Pseudomonadota bacterium]